MSLVAMRRADLPQRTPSQPPVAFIVDPLPFACEAIP